MTVSPPPPGHLRRLGALLYDGLLLLAILILLSLPYVWLTEGAPQAMWARMLYRIYLLSICFFYFAGFWVHGGQTLGLRTWKLKLVARDGGLVTWKRALLRFASAWVSLLCAGLGFLWMFYDRERRTWHDCWSCTYLVQVSYSSRANPS